MNLYTHIRGITIEIDIVIHIAVMWVVHYFYSIFQKRNRILLGKCFCYFTTRPRQRLFFLFFYLLRLLSTRFYSLFLIKNTIQTRDLLVFILFCLSNIELKLVIYSFLLNQLSLFRSLFSFSRLFGALFPFSFTPFCLPLLLLLPLPELLILLLLVE